MSRKLVSAALAATTLVWAVGVAALPVASAQSTASLQAQIQALLAQIAQLQAQMGTTSTQTTTTSSYTFTKDLTLGSTGADVTALQQMLINDGYLTAVSQPTGYFGALTQKALAAFQAAKGISPAAGYFGPKTRAFVNSMSVGTSTTTTTTTGTTTTGTTTTGVQTTSGVVAPSSGLAVSLASLPAGSTQSLISGSTGGAARTPVLAVNLTAGTSGGVTVSAINFHKLGVLSDSAVAGAYLTQNGKVLYQYNSLNQGVLSFSGMSLSVPAGQTVTLDLAIDVSSGLSAGNTASFSLNSASDVTAFDANNNALTASGTFPLTGSTLTVTNVTNPSLATLSVSSSSIGTSVTAGTQGNLVGAWNFSVGNNKVYLDSINFRVIGSAALSNIQNVKLMVNGTQVGPTLPSVGADGTAYFDASSAPGVLNTGSNNVQIFADIMGSPSYNFQFEILNGFDVYAVDSQYNVPITANSSDGSQVTIQQGTITVTQDANTPTGNIAKGQSQITIAKFDIYAAGEPVKVQYLPFSLAFTGVVTSTSQADLNNVINNVAIVDDAGGQVGTTINQPPSANYNTGVASTYDSTGLSISGAGAAVLVPVGGQSGTVTYEDSFGTAASPINYIVPANTTRVLSLRVDIENTANFSQVTGSILQPNTNNLQGMVSSQSAMSSGAQGSQLSLAQSSLTVSQNNALGSQTVVAGTSGVEIGSYALSASSAEGVNVNNLTVKVGSMSPTPFQNLKVQVNGTQFGTTQSTVSPSTAYTFSGTPFTVPAGSTVDVNVYADSLSSATNSTTGGATSLTGISGTGAISFSSISLASPIQGQDLTFASGQTMTIAADSSQPAASTLTMGSTGNTLAVYRFQETSNVGQVKISGLTVEDTETSPTSTALPAFNNVQLWSGSTLLGTAGSASSTGAAVAHGSQTNCTNIPGTGNATTSASGTITVTGADSLTGATTEAVTVTVGTLGSNQAGTPFNVSASTATSTLLSDLVTEIDGITFGGGIGGGYWSAVASGTNEVIVTAPSAAGATGNTYNVAVTGTSSGYVYSESALTGGENYAAPSQSCSQGSQESYNYTFNFSPDIVVPQGNTTLVTLKGDIGSYSGAGATDDSVHTFSLATSSITALGATAGLPVTVSGGTASGNQMTVLRSVLTVSTSPSSFTQNGKQPNQEIGSVTLTANNAGPVELNSLTLTFSGSNVTGTNLTSFVTNTVALETPNQINVNQTTGNGGFGANQTFAFSPATTTASAVSSTWTFTTPIVVSPGSPVTLQLWGNTSAITGIASVAESLSAAIQNTTDAEYYDNTSGTGSLVPLPTNAVPLTVSSFSWGTGQ